MNNKKKNEKKKKRRCQVGPPLAKHSGSAHACGQGLQCLLTGRSINIGIKLKTACQPTIENGVVLLIGWENLFGINGLILKQKNQHEPLGTGLSCYCPARQE